MPEAEVVGFYDPQPTYLAMIGEDMPRFPTLAAMLSDARADLLFVGSPNSFHLDQIRAGPEAGLLVFAEKPVVVSVEETMQIAELLTRHGPERVMVGLVLRYSRHMTDLRAALREGALGEGVSLEASEPISPSHGAFFTRDWCRHSHRSGSFMLEKRCHDLDLCNGVTASRPRWVASFGGRRSFLARHAPAANAEAEMFHVKQSVWESTDDPFGSNGDIVDHQTALLDYESGATLAFHTNLNVPDEHRRFCVIGTHGMAEGDFVRGPLRITRRDGTRHADHDCADGSARGAHYGADDLMVRDVAAYLRGEAGSLPVGSLTPWRRGSRRLPATRRGGRGGSWT